MLSRQVPGWILPTAGFLASAGVVGMILPLVLVIVYPYVYGATTWFVLYFIGLMAGCLTPYSILRSLTFDLDATMVKGWRRLFKGSLVVTLSLGSVALLATVLPSWGVLLFVQFFGCLTTSLGVLTFRAARMRPLLNEGSVAR